MLDNNGVLVTGDEGVVENPRGMNWDVKLAYKRGAFSISGEVDEESAWKILTSYDLGGGLKIEGGARDRGTVTSVNGQKDTVGYLGVGMTF